MTNDTHSGFTRHHNRLAGRALRLAAVAVTFFALWPEKTSGVGFRIPNQDAAAIARGNAFVATADNPSAIYYNPAGISQLEGQHVQLGVLNYLGIKTYFDGAAGGDMETDFEVIPLPQLYYTCDLEDTPFTLGLGLYAPFGLGVEWPDKAPMHAFAIESRMMYLTLNPVVAWKPHPTFSIGAGPMFNYSKAKLKRGLGLSPLLGPPDIFEYEGDDFSVGFNAGLLWQPHEQWSFGVNYRCSGSMEYDGDAKYESLGLTSKVDATVRLPFPQIASAGVSYRPTPQWNIEFNVDYTDWNTLNTLTFRGTRNLGLVPTDLSLQLDWKESWFYEIGVTRYFEDGWYASAGYFYCSETAPESTFSASVPDTELHVGSIGFGRNGEKWSWAVAGQIIAGPERKVDSSPSAPPGTYQLIIPTVSFSVSRKF